MDGLVGAIPAQCKKCGELFDISYDLEDLSQERLLFELIKSVRNPKSGLCWECRKGKYSKW